MECLQKIILHTHLNLTTLIKKTRKKSPVQKYIIKEENHYHPH